MKNKSFFSSKAFRKGTLSVVLTAIVIVAVILVNVVATAVSQRYPFSLDLTANKDYTIALTDEYTSFIQEIGQPVSMTVCAAEDDFSGGNYANFMVQNLMLTDYYNGTVAESTTKYARQVSLFLQSFPTLNKNISVTFANPNSVTDFAPVSTKYAEETLNYGDIIISCEHPATDGGTFERYQIVGMDDIFTVEMDQEMYYQYGASAYQITGSALAGNVVSSLYIVTSEESVEVAVFGGHDADAEYAGMLETFLKKNNYTFTQIDSLLNAEIKDQTVFGILSAPTTDYSAEELKALEAFLENDGKYGRVLVYLPSCGQPVLPNLEEFLVEWGIRILPAVSYSETQGEYYQYPYNIFAQPAESEYTEDFDPANDMFYPMNYRLMETAFENQNGYLTETILQTGQRVYGLPIGDDIPDDWTTADSQYNGQFPLVVLSTYQKAAGATSVAGESHVLAISGDYFMYDEVLKTSGMYNSTLLLNLFNGLSGQEEGKAVNIEDKVISTTSFADKIMNTYTPLVMMLVFVLIVPLSLVAISLTIWIKRKRR